MICSDCGRKKSEALGHFYSWQWIMHLLGMLRLQGLITNETEEQACNYMMNLKGLVMDADEEAEIKEKEKIEAIQCRYPHCHPEQCPCEEIEPCKKN